MLSEMFCYAFKYFWKHVINYTKLVIDYQRLKLFITAIRILNSNFKACNRLDKDCNRLLEGIFKNNSQESHLFKSFLNDSRRLINRWLGIRNSLENWNVLSSHKDSLAKHLQIQQGILSDIQLLHFFLKRETSSSSYPKRLIKESKIS